MSHPTSHRRFSTDEAGELVGRATELTNKDEGLSYDDLINVAAEVGIDKDKVDEALRQAEAERRRRHSVSPAWRSITDRCLEILCLKPARPT